MLPLMAFEGNGAMLRRQDPLPFITVFTDVNPAMRLGRNSTIRFTISGSLSSLSVVLCQTSAVGPTIVDANNTWSVVPVLEGTIQASWFKKTRLQMLHQTDSDQIALSSRMTLVVRRISPRYQRRCSTNHSQFNSDCPKIRQSRIAMT